MLDDVMSLSHNIFRHSTFTIEQRTADSGSMASMVSLVSMVSMVSFIPSVQRFMSDAWNGVSPWQDALITSEAVGCMGIDAAEIDPSKT